MSTKKKTQKLLDSALIVVCVVIHLIQYFDSVISARSCNNPFCSSGSEKNTKGPWWPCNAHLSIIALREPDLELIKANILTKIHNDYINK